MKQAGFFCYAVFILLLSSCKRFLDASVPDTRWALFDSSAALPLTADVHKNLEGVYKISIQDDDYGNEAAMKWTYSITGKDTTYTLSIFCKEDVRYFICQGKKIGDSILLNGYWRNVENTKTGKAHLFVLPQDGATNLLQGKKFFRLTINGKVGFGDEEPDDDIRFTYERPLYNKTPLEIVAHRGGGRNSDLLPASENSLDLIKLASVYGATGVELDVKLTKDSVAMLYHDANVNDRLTNQTGVRPPIAKYTFAELMKKVRLKDEQKIPTLKEALETVLNNTPLQFIWLDTKNPEAVPLMHQLQKEYTAKAAAMGRKMEIVIGIPDEDAMKEIQNLPAYKNIPTVSELDAKKALQVNAAIWAQSWTKGLQKEEVEQMHAKGKRVYVWTLDVPKVISHYLSEGSFDGIVTNRPSIAAFYYYAKK